MFKNIKVFPDNNHKEKKHLETVPTDKQMKVADNAYNTMATTLTGGSVAPITFFDIGKDAKKYQIGAIMEVPTIVAGLNNLSVARSVDLYNKLSMSDLVLLNAHNCDIQAGNTLGLLKEAVYNNFYTFVSISNIISCLDEVLANSTEGYTVKNSMYNQFVVYMNEKMDQELYLFLKRMFSQDIHRASDMDINGNVVNQGRLDRTIALISGYSKQLVDLITMYICDFVNTFVATLFSEMSDGIIESIIKVVKQQYNINHSEQLNSAVTLKSFVDESFMFELTDLANYAIIPNVNHISDNAMLSYYFVYKDIMEDKKKEMIAKDPNIVD